MANIQDKGVERTSDSLEGRRIAYAVTGGIGSVEAVKMIREIRRRGAEVTAFMTSDAEKFITPLSLEWAANRPVVRSQGAGVEHLDEYDMVVVAPATLNTINKAAMGAADNAVLLLLAGQIGRKGRLIFVPTMNEQLAAHPQLKASQEMLVKWGARFFEVPLEESRLKMPEPMALAEFIEKEFKNGR